MADLAIIKSNVAKMVSMNAPERDIDRYIASEGVTIDDVRNYSDEQPLNNDFAGKVATFTRGADFGFGRKLGGLINALGAYPVDRAAQALGVENTPSFTDRYNEIVKQANQAEQEYKENNPLGAAALELGGAVVNPLNKLGVGFIGKGASTLGKVARSGAVGAGTAALSGLGADGVQGEDLATGAVLGSAIPVAGKALSPIGKALTNISGSLTGAGAESIKRAYDAGKRGSQTFLKNLRGQTSAENVVGTAKEELRNMVEGNQDLYRAATQKAFSDTTRIPMQSINKKFQQLYDIETLGGHNILKDDTKKVFKNAKELLKEFNANEDLQNAQGLDILKRRIQDIDVKPGTNASRIRKELSDNIKDAIQERNPEYKQAMKRYAENKAEIDELSKTFSLNNKATIDTALRKLQSVMRNNVNTNYGRRFEQLSNLDFHGDLQDAIAGQALNALTARGLGKIFTGAGAGLAMYNPIGAAATLASTSPRVSGETAYMLGKQSSNIKKALEKMGLNKNLTPYIVQQITGGND